MLPAVGTWAWDRIIAGISRVCGFFPGYRDPRQPTGIRNDVFLDPGRLIPQSSHTPLLQPGYKTTRIQKDIILELLDPGRRIPQL